MAGRRARPETQELYNQRFNRLVPTVDHGSHLTMPGLARYIGPGQDIKPFQPAPHQKYVIWRIVCSGTTRLTIPSRRENLLHDWRGQEQRRLVAIRLPMYVVPNDMLEQFAREFLQAYPAADILVAHKELMTKESAGLSARIVAATTTRS